MVLLVGKMFLDPVGVFCGILGVPSGHTGPKSYFPLTRLCLEGFLLSFFKGLVLSPASAVSPVIGRRVPPASASLSQPQPALASLTR